jgi:hypothetical protein
MELENPHLQPFFRPEMELWTSKMQGEFSTTWPGPLHHMKVTVCLGACGGEEDNKGNKSLLSAFICKISFFEFVWDLLKFYVHFLLANVCLY